MEGSTLSLPGLVRHLADVERSWFRNIMAGQEVPPLFRTEDDPDAAFNGARPGPALVAQAWLAWRGPLSLRWVLVHTVEEHARHNGHAGLLRQRIDGRVGQ